MEKSKTTVKSIMVKFLLGLIFALLFNDMGFAEWVSTYGGYNLDRINSITRTTDGGFVGTGDTYSYGKGTNDVWVMKLDKDGGITWQNSYGGSGVDTANLIQQTSDGGYIVAGFSNSFNSNINKDVDGWILKLDKDGNVQWQKTYGGDQSDIIYSIQQTSDGYIAVGTTNSFGAGAADAWVLKLDNQGNVMWQKAFGGTADDEARSVQATDSGYFVAGVTQSFGTGVGSGTAGDAWILKLDANGNTVWQKAYGGSGYDAAYSIKKTTDGGFIVAGESSSFGDSAMNNDVWIFRIDGNGNVSWGMTYGGDSIDIANSIQQTTDGGYIVAGETSSFGEGGDAWILKLAADGTLQWEKTYGSMGDDKAYAVEEIVDNGTSSGYIIAGVSPLFNAESYDALIMSVDSTGSVAGCSTIVTSEAQIAGVSAVPTVTDTSISKQAEISVTGTDTTVSASAINDNTRQEICSTVKDLYMLTVSAVYGPTGAGTGKVVSIVGNVEDNLINCNAGGSGDCIEVYNSQGIMVTLKAVPEPDSGTVFSGWSGVPCSKKSLTCKVTMDESKNVTATFDVQKFSIKSASTNGGTIVPDGELVPLPTKTVTYGGQLKYTINVNDGFEIASVKIDGNIIDPAKYYDNTYTFVNVTKNYKIFVNFRLKTYTITASASDGGKITPTGQIPVKSGKSKVFTIKPSKKYKLTELRIDDQPVELQNKYKFTGVTSDHTIEAIFSPK